jgi:hypothetical protein
VVTTSLINHTYHVIYPSYQIITKIAVAWLISHGHQITSIRLPGDQLTVTKLSAHGQVQNTLTQSFTASDVASAPASARAPPPPWWAHRIKADLARGDTAATTPAMAIQPQSAATTPGGGAARNHSCSRGKVGSKRRPMWSLRLRTCGLASSGTGWRAHNLMAWGCCRLMVLLR